MNLSVIMAIVYLYQRRATVLTIVVTTAMRPTVTAEDVGVCAYINTQSLLFLALRVVDTFQH